MVCQKKTRSKLLSALVFSHLHFASTLLSGVSKNVIISLEKQLSLAVKTSCDTRKYVTSADLKLNSIFRNICYVCNNIILKSKLKCNKTSLKVFKKRLKAHSRNDRKHGLSSDVFPLFYARNNSN